MRVEAENAEIHQEAKNALARYNMLTEQNLYLAKTNKQPVIHTVTRANVCCSGSGSSGRNSSLEQLAASLSTEPSACEGNYGTFNKLA